MYLRMKVLKNGKKCCTSARGTGYNQDFIEEDFIEEMMVLIV
jgi:hypothetical protein